VLCLTVSIVDGRLLCCPSRLWRLTATLMRFQGVWNVRSRLLRFLSRLFPKIHHWIRRPASQRI
jgi:hypothetical protein